jgi:hypothetical protein
MTRASIFDVDLGNGGTGRIFATDVTMIRDARGTIHVVGSCHFEGVVWEDYGDGVVAFCLHGDREDCPVRSSSGTYQIGTLARAWSPTDTMNWLPMDEKGWLTK